MKNKAIQLVETRQGCAICETTPRYDIVLHGTKWGQLYFNLRGYVGNLPLPNGSKLCIGERPITEYKREVAKLNREWARECICPTISNEYENQRQQQKNIDDGFRWLQKGG